MMRARLPVAPKALPRILEVRLEGDARSDAGLHLEPGLTLRLFIPRAMLDDDRFDRDDALDPASALLADFDPALILAAILDRRP